MAPPAPARPASTPGPRRPRGPRGTCGPRTRWPARPRRECRAPRPRAARAGWSARRAGRYAPGRILRTPRPGAGRGSRRPRRRRPRPAAPPRQCLLRQGLSPGRVLRAGAQGEPGGEPESRRRQRPGQLVQRHIHLGGADLGAASALEPRGTGELAEHRDGQAGRVMQRQHAAVVLQQHEALRGRAAGQRMVRPRVRIRRAPGPGPQHQPEHPGHRLVEHRLREPPGGHRGDDGPVAEPEVGRHLQVQPGGQGGDPVMHRAPVRHDQPVEAPLVPEHLGQQPPVLRRVLAVDLVVGAHHRPRPGCGDHVLEGGQVDLAQGALVHVGADPEPVGLLVVRREVLHARPDLLRLQAVHQPGGEPAGQERVLGQVLEVAPAQRRALDVDPGAEDDRDVLGARLGAQRRAHLPGQPGVPGAGERGGGREAGGRHAPADARMVGAVGLLAQPVRPVGQHDRLDAGRRDRRGVPEVRAQAQRGLLIQGEPAEKSCHRVLVRHATILAQPRSPRPRSGLRGRASVDSRWLKPCGARARRRAEVTTLTVVVRRIRRPAAALSALTSAWSSAVRSAAETARGQVRGRAEAQVGPVHVRVAGARPAA